MDRESIEPIQHTPSHLSLQISTFGFRPVSVSPGLQVTRISRRVGFDCDVSIVASAIVFDQDNALPRDIHSSFLCDSV